MKLNIVNIDYLLRIIANRINRNGNPKSIKIAKIIAYIILSVIFVPISLIIIFSLIIEISFYFQDKTYSIEGQVLKLSESKVKIKYYIDGKEYNQDYELASKFNNGETVKVYYDKNDKSSIVGVTDCIPTGVLDYIFTLLKIFVLLYIVLLFYKVHKNFRFQGVV